MYISDWVAVGIAVFMVSIFPLIVHAFRVRRAMRKFDRWLENATEEEREYWDLYMRMENEWHG